MKGMWIKKEDGRERDSRKEQRHGGRKEMKNLTQCLL